MAHKTHKVFHCVWCMQDGSVTIAFPTFVFYNNNDVIHTKYLSEQSPPLSVYVCRQTSEQVGNSNLMYFLTQASTNPFCAMFYLNDYLETYDREHRESHPSLESVPEVA